MSEDELIKYLKANLLLQIRNLPNDENQDKKKLEILLYKAGFAHQEIAEILGKSYASVRKAVSRAKKNGKENES
jgi:DNA-directed RNA polymerase specialized sigma24 family protein